MGGLTLSAPPVMHVLVLNSGSSSLKFGVYRMDDGRATMLLDGEVEQSDTGRSTMRARDGRGEIVRATAIEPDQRHALDRIAVLMVDENLPRPVAVGHRVVHGGIHLQRHRVIDDDVMGELQAACALAPLHLPPALSAIRYASQKYPEIPQVACLDTAFHAQLDEVARVLPIPRSFEAEGIRRYGFHGLSCESIVRGFGGDLPKRLVIAHLGNGASITAVREGRSIDTTMGLTPTGGIVMGTRSGDLDPGVLIYLLRERGFDVETLDDLLNHRSGLAGISGIGSDMRQLRAAAGKHPEARLAIELFCYSVRKQIAAMVAALGGADALVFTGGIGENDALARSAICDGLGWTGLYLDDSHTEGVISSALSRIVVHVLPSREDEQMAMVVAATLRDAPRPPAG